MGAYVVVLVTVSSAAEGRKMARALVREKLAACVNGAPGLLSTYRWKGKVEEAREELLFIKTRKDKTKALIARVKALHSYSVPEVIALPVVRGNAGYLRWIDESLKGGRGAV